MNILSKEQISNLPEWMVIEGFPKYEVNCRQGIIRSLYTGKILKPSPDSYGYPRVSLWKDGKHNTKKFHRIVAESAFGYYGIPTADLDVCHLDETRTNSGIDNLALGTTKENMNFPKAKQRVSESSSKKTVGAYKDGRLILKFESTREAHRNGFNSSHIAACCKGKLKHHKGYEWRYLSA